jgi:hypothetical protein
MLVPPEPQYESAKDHRQTNPNIGSHHDNTILLIIAQPLTHENGKAVLGLTSRERMSRTRKIGALETPGGSNFAVVRTGRLAQVPWSYRPPEVGLLQMHCFLSLRLQAYEQLSDTLLQAA